MSQIRPLDRGFRSGHSVHVLMEDGSTTWATVVSAKNHPTSGRPQNWRVRVRVHLETQTGGFREYNLSGPGVTPGPSVVVLIDD